MSWMKAKVSQSLLNYGDADVSKIPDISGLSKSIKGFGNEFVKISDAVAQDDEGEYSHTTEEVSKNIEAIKGKDVSNEKRFNIGHRIFDNATKGVRYGDLIMFLGNVNTGKSMVLANVVYNLWKSGANVLLLTCEMKPNEFDERIYSRATNIEYDAIINASFSDADKMAFDVYIQEVARKSNKIVTKFLKATDNVGTVDSYVEDLKLKRDFIPDVIVVDSLEHISPLDPAIEDKDNLKVAQIIKEFKDYAQTFMSNRGLVVISTHQAKTDTFDKSFEDISIVDFGRSKVAAEKPDFALYIRSKAELNTMNVKLIKARRTAAGITWPMAIDFSKCLVMDTQDSLNSEMLTGD
jgi:archaellum biogenesis ATPase FlaH